MKRLHIVGRKNSGKTTLIVELVSYLRSQGVRVGTIKHTHHQHELDVPGKDSYRHRTAGASAVGILSPGMNAVFWPTQAPDQPAESAGGKYALFESLFAPLDLVLVEGDLYTTAPKVEVWRPEVGVPPLAGETPGIRAVIGDVRPPELSHSVPLWPRSHLADLVAHLRDLVPHRGAGG